MDLISRQAAIEAIEHLQMPIMRSQDYGEQFKFTGMAEAREAIIGLPSAQPEIVRCGQCKYAEVADAQDNQDGYTCQFHRGSIWFSGSYCSWGERRTDEQTR